MATKRSKTTAAPAALHPDAAALHARVLAEFDFSDGASLAVLREMCGTLDRLRQVQSVITAEGLTVTGSTGQPRPHPLLATEDMLRRSLLAHARSLRLTVEA